MTDYFEQLLNPNSGAIPDSERKKTIARLAKIKGHAWQPGTGPIGETCKSCKHYVTRQWSKTYRKCGLMQTHWTRGAGTDIRASDPACKKWERGE